MIALLDTNVIISSMLSSKGPPARIMEAWEAEQFDILTSPALLRELKRAIHYPHVQRYYKGPEKKIDAFLREFQRAAVMVEPENTLEVIEEDPADDRVLECAVAGRADYIVSGDNHLLKREDYRGIIILRPRVFLAVLKLGSES